MSRVNHLKRRSSGVYVVRLVVPAWLRAAAGQRELHRSTGCRDLALAKVVGSEIVADWHRRLARFRVMDPKKLQAGAVELLGDGEVLVQDAARALGADPRELLGRLIEMGVPIFVRVAQLAGWRIPDTSELHDGHDIDGFVESFDVSPANLRRLGDRQQYTGILKLHLTDDVTAIANTCDPVAVTLFSLPRRSTGSPGASLGAFVADDPGLPATVASLFVRRRDVESLRQSLLGQIPSGLLEVMTSAAAAPSSAAFDSIAKTKYKDRPVSELTERYLAVRAREVKLDEQRRQRDACTALVELTNNVKLGECDRDMMRAVGQELARVPADRHILRRKYGATATGSWRKLIEIGAREGLPTLTASAIERLLEDVQAVFAWGVNEGWLRENPAAKLGAEFFRRSGGVRKQGSKKRDAFSDDDLQQIFAVEWFRDGVGRKTPNGTFHSYRPHYYWLPLLGLFTGARINELSQLYLDDIRYETESGCWYIDINENKPDKLPHDEDDDDELFSAESGAALAVANDVGEKSLKTSSAIRVVPIHPRLIELGLLRYCEALGDAGYTRLFPELKFDATKGYGKAPTKWFGDSFLKRRLNMARDGRKVFHSFRHNFVTALERAQAPIAAVKQLAGHSDASRSGNVTDGYTKQRAVAELAPVIVSLSSALPPIEHFNVEQGLLAVQCALKLKKSHQR